METQISWLTLHRWDAPTEPASYTMNPIICLIAQGVKQVVLGEKNFVYDAAHFLVSSVDLPIVANIIEATPHKPYLGVILELDLKKISQLIVDGGLPMAHSGTAHKGMAVGRLCRPLIIAFQRLMDLLDEQENIPVLAPLIKREIFFRLLKTEQGPRLQQITASGSHSHQISKAVTWLKNNYTRHLRVEDMAASAGMSKSAFHNHFKEVTSMTPLQL